MGEGSGSEAIDSLKGDETMKGIDTIIGSEAIDSLKDNKTMKGNTHDKDANPIDTTKANDTMKSTTLYTTLLHRPLPAS